MRNFKKESFLWRHLLPNRTLHALGDTHEEVIQAQAATGAKLMQEVFDAALERQAHDVGLRNGYSDESSVPEADRQSVGREFEPLRARR